MWTVPNTGVAGGDVWDPKVSPKGNFTDAAWGESIEECPVELKKKLQKAKAENADLQRQIIQFEVQLLTAQVGDAYVDESDIPLIVSELGRQNQELKKAAEQDAKLRQTLKEEIASLKKQLAEKKAVPEPESNASQIEVLQKYIRVQAKEFVEGKAEGSKQIAEMKNDLEHKIEKMRREKDEALRQCEQHQQRISVGNGVENSMMVSADQQDSADVVLLREKCAVAESRVSELETYIRRNPAVTQRDNRDLFLQTSIDMKKQEFELAELRKRHQECVEFWDQNCQRLIAAVQGHLSGKEFCRSADEVLQAIREKSPLDDLVTLASSSIPEGDDESNIYSVLHSVAVDLQRFLRVAQQREPPRLPPKMLRTIRRAALNESGNSDAVARDAAIQGRLDELKSSRREVAGVVMKLEKGLRDMVKDLRTQVTDLLKVEPTKKFDMTSEALIGYALSESENVLPLDENDQRKALCAVRRMEYLSGSLFSSFVELPELLKRLFDITKHIAAQDAVNDLRQEVQNLERSTKTAENRHNLHVSLLERRVAEMTLRRTPQRRRKSLADPNDESPKSKILLRDLRTKSEPKLLVCSIASGSEDSVSVSRGSRDVPEVSRPDDKQIAKVVRSEIRAIMKRDDCEDQLVELGLDVRRHLDQIQEQLKRLDQLEEHIIDLHTSRQENSLPMPESVEVPAAYLMGQAPPMIWAAPQFPHQRRRTRNHRGGAQHGGRQSNARQK